MRIVISKAKKQGKNTFDVLQLAFEKIFHWNI